MAAPNLTAPTAIYLKSIDPVLLSVVGTPTSILANAAASGKVLKLNALRFSNGDDADVNYKGGLLFKKNGGAAKLIGFHTVAARSAQLMISRNEVVYLAEGDELLGYGSTTNKLYAFGSYEEIS